MARVSNDGPRGHPSRRGQVAAPQDDGVMHGLRWSRFLSDVTASSRSATGRTADALSAHPHRRTKAAGAAHHPEPAGKAQRAEQSSARRNLRGAGGGRSRSRNFDFDSARRRSVFFGRLRPVVGQFGRSALSLGGGAGAMVAACGRGLVRNLGSCKTRDRAGARLLSCRRHGARHRLRRGLCRRRCPDRLSAGAADVRRRTCSIIHGWSACAAPWN